MTIRDEQKEKRKMDILIAGLDLFISKGYTAAKISDIASKANMSVGLLFHYFESKEKLYEELIKIGLQGTQKSFHQAYKNPLDFFEQTIIIIFDSIKSNPWVAKMFILMAQAQRSDSTPDSIRQLALQVNNIEQSIELVKQGQQTGSIRQGNPYALSNAFWCSVQGIAEQIAIHPETPMPEPEWILSILKSEGLK